MDTEPLFRILDCADAAFTVEFGDAIHPALQERVRVLDAAIAHAQAGGALAGLIETVPTFRSLTVLYDPVRTTQDELLAAITPLIGTSGAADAAPVRHWRLPACYDDAFGPDLDEVARTVGCSRDDVVALHTGGEYVVYMLGFLPGFPFMGDVAPALALPRRAEPRVRVPAGSVAIATGLTAIYPWESPGGWHLLARCAVPLFDVRRRAPALLQAGDRVRFVPVERSEYERLAAALAHGELDPAALIDDDGGRP